MKFEEVKEEAERITKWLSKSETSQNDFALFIKLLLIDGPFDWLQVFGMLEAIKFEIKGFVDAEMKEENKNG